MILSGKGVTIPFKDTEDYDDEEFNNNTTTRVMRHFTKYINLG